MQKEKLLIYSNRENEIDEYARLLADRAGSVDLLVCKTLADLESSIEEAEIIFGVHLPAALYLRAKKLRWIQSMWAGVEGLLSANISEDVLITKPWGVFGKYLSQYVFGYLLAHKIKLIPAYEAQKARKWEPYRIELLKNKCMGFAGMGDIASEIAVIAKAFGMRVWALNSDGRSHPLAERSFGPAEKCEFVAGLDLLVIIMPANKNTRAFFSSDLLSYMRKDALLINIGRGSVIDDQALIEVLEQNKIAAAILDVFQEEPLPEDHPYWTLPNCIVTPHIGGPSLPEDICACFLENLKRYRSGQTLSGLVSRERGY